MAKTEHYYIRFEEGTFYHVYNRAVNKKPMFTKSWNYRFFLNRMEKYILPYADIYSFCLLENHFHLLLKIKQLQKDLKTLKELSNPNENINEFIEETVNKDIHYIVSGAFRKMFQSYAMAFNKQEGRIGTLFQTPFKRSEIDSEEYLVQIIYYIHNNPQKHHYIGDFRKYPYSSYPYYLKKAESPWVHDDMYKLFEGYKEFVDFHNKIHDLPKNIPLKMKEL